MELDKVLNIEDSLYHLDFQLVKFQVYWICRLGVMIHLMCLCRVMSLCRIFRVSRIFLTLGDGIWGSIKQKKLLAIILTTHLQNFISFGDVPPNIFMHERVMSEQQICSNLGKV